MRNIAITNVVTTVISTLATATTVVDEKIDLLSAPNYAPQPSVDVQVLNGSVVTTAGLTMYVLSMVPIYVIQL